MWHQLVVSFARPGIVLHLQAVELSCVLLISLIMDVRCRQELDVGGNKRLQRQDSSQELYNKLDEWWLQQYLAGRSRKCKSGDMFVPQTVSDNSATASDGKKLDEMMDE